MASDATTVLRSDRPAAWTSTHPIGCGNGIHVPDSSLSGTNLLNIHRNLSVPNDGFVIHVISTCKVQVEKSLRKKGRRDQYSVLY